MRVNATLTHQKTTQEVLNDLVRRHNESAARERKRKASESKDELIALLLPPKSAKTDYEEQKPAKYVFKCMDGDIQIPEYGILRTEFYYQQVNLEARKADENGHIFNYQNIPKSSVKYFTDALFGIMPECKDIVETMQLMNFLLFDGQASTDFGSDFELRFMENIWKQLQRLIKEAKFEAKAYALVMFYFLSLNKPEFDQYAKQLSVYTDKESYYSLSWYITMGYNDPSKPEYEKLINFLRDNCDRNDWNITDWLKIQSKKADSL